MDLDKVILVHRKIAKTNKHLSFTLSHTFTLNASAIFIGPI